MDDQSLTPQAQVTPAAVPHRRALWPLAAVAIVAVAGGGAGAYFGLRGAAGPGSGPAAGPAARAFAAAAYDEASHQVVLFGGIGAAGSDLDDTWTWDGSIWTRQHPQVSPPARAFAAMTYDPKNHDVVLVGGSSGGGQQPTVCSGTATVSGPNATPGPARSPMPCAFKGPTQLHDTWLWDGSTWRAAGTAPRDWAGESPALGTDPTTGQVLLLAQTTSLASGQITCPEPAPIVGGGGSGAPVPQPAIACAMPVIPTLQAWLWSGGRWSPLPAGPPASGRGVGLGGPGTLVADPTSGHLADVTAWVQIACAGAMPAGAVPPCPLYEGAGGGSASGSGSSAATGKASPLTSIAAPAPQAQTPNATVIPAIAPAPNQVPPATAPPVPVETAPEPSRPATCCTDTVMTWTGTGWSKAATYDNGPELMPSTLAGDPAQHDVVGVTPLGTWTWNGAAWKHEHPSTSPPPAEGSTVVYDGACKRLLLFGGEPIAARPATGQSSGPWAAPVSDELWAWDGTSWSQLSGTKASPQSLPPTPTPTFVPPAPPVPASPPSSSAPLPSLLPAPCSPIATSTPSGGTSTGANRGCAVPATSVPSGGPTAP